MIIKRKVIYRLNEILNLISYFLMLLFIWRKNILRNGISHFDSVLILCIITFLYYYICNSYKVFSLKFLKIAKIIISQILSSILLGFIIIVLSPLIFYKFNIFYSMICFIIQALFALIFLFLCEKLLSKINTSERALIICGCNNKFELDDFINSIDSVFQIKKVISVSELSDNHFGLLNNFEIIFLINIHSHLRNQIIKYCAKNKIIVYVLPRIGDIIMSGAQKINMFHLPVLKLNRYSSSYLFLFNKRVFDLLFSGFLLIITSPLFFILSILIKLSDGGPIFYKQKRLTINAEVFELIKFRSMTVDAESDGIARLSSGHNDKRVTKIGKFIRRFRMDELPQLLNILKGDMSVVGPRPERPEIAKKYSKFLPEFNLRLQVKAGLTGYAQVYGKYNTNPYDKLELDLMYISHPTLFEDIKIIILTIRILFSSESTDGFNEK